MILNFLNLPRLFSTSGKFRVGKVRLRWDDCWHGTPPSSYLKKDPCAYCGEKGGTIDHIYPKNPRRKLKGGLKTGFNPFHWTNYTGCCERCNTQKSNQHLFEFLIMRNKPLGGKE